MSPRKRKISFLVFLTFISLIVYSGGRVFFYFSYVSDWLSTILAGLLLMAEIHSVIHSLGFVISIIRLRKTGVNYHRRAVLNRRWLPSVTILVPARNEPLDILEQTFITIKCLNYSNKRIVFLDGSDEKYTEDNVRLAQKYSLEYFHPEKPAKSKAAIINQYLPRVDSKYLSVFDADQNPMPEFLSDTVSLAEFSGNIAFIQTPQLYSNYTVSPIARGAALQQSIFYENICESKGSVDAMFCCGTNFLMRTEVLKEVGGFDEQSVTEDFATSVKIHSLGYRSIYYNHVRVFGMAPETLPAYFKQQYRWSSGSVGVLMKLLHEWWAGRLHLSFVQTWEYFLSATYYFTGWSFFILMISPAIYLLFNVPSFFVNPIFYLGTFIPYYLLTMIIFHATMSGRNYKMRDVFMGIIMGQLSFPILIKSSTAAILGWKTTFQITEKGQIGRLAWWKLWPWASMMILMLAAIIVGVLRLHEDAYSIGINMVWCIYHFTLLSTIFMLNRSPHLEKNEILKYV